MTTTNKQYCKRCCDTLTADDVEKGETLCTGCFEYLTACQRRRDTAIRHGLKFYPHPRGDRYILPVSSDSLEDRYCGGSNPDYQGHKKGDPRGIQFIEELWQALEKAEWPE